MDEDVSESEERDFDFDVPTEPAAVHADLRDEFESEIENGGVTTDFPHETGALDYSPELRDATIDAVATYLWDQWESALVDAAVSRERFGEVVELSTYASLQWVHEKVDWDFLVSDVISSLNRMDELFDDGEPTE